MEGVSLYDARLRHAPRACRLPLCAHVLAVALGALAPGIFALAQSAHAATVAVDVGHYKSAPGATSARGRAEFDFNLDLAQDIAAALPREGLAAKIIGADGMMEQLTARTRAAAGTDFFLAVHHDSVQERFIDEWQDEGMVRRYSDRYAGFSLFVSRKDPRLEQSLACASAMGAALIEAGFTRSLYHAEPIDGESKPFADRAHGVHYYDNLVVLKTASSPAVLFEAGVIVNRDEELRIAAPAVRAAIAAAVAKGLRACLQVVR